MAEHVVQNHDLIAEVRRHERSGGEVEYFKNDDGTWTIVVAQRIEER